MSGIIAIVAFLILLGILVLAHELGHFATARAFGIAVDEFGIGFPPHALTIAERNGVRYTINWLPLGGFVRFRGRRR
jgi:regulator of sigma E protease